MSGKFGLIAALVLLLVGAVVWSRVLLSKPRVSVESLRDVAGMVLEVEPLKIAEEGMSVGVRLKNQTSRTATSVVFTVEVVDGTGQVLAENPLGNILNMQPNEVRTMPVPIPSATRVDADFDVITRGRVNLVRWKD